MNSRITALLIGSYAGQIVAVVGGLVLMPELFSDHPHSGISFWGNYFPAVVPFVMGFVITVGCLVYAAHYMLDYPGRLQAMRRLLLGIAFGFALILVTPDEANAVLYWAHSLAAIYLFVVAGWGSVWIVLQTGRTTTDWFLFGTIVVGSAVSLLSSSFVGVLGILAFGQLLTFNSVALLIMRTARRWTDLEGSAGLVIRQAQERGQTDSIRHE